MLNGVDAGAAHVHVDGAVVLPEHVHQCVVPGIAADQVPAASAIQRVVAGSRRSSTSTPMPPLRVSLPDPPSSRSLPLPPSSVSSPVPPSSTSLPIPPSNVSFPMPPFSCRSRPRRAAGRCRLHRSACRCRRRRSACRAARTSDRVVAAAAVVRRHMRIALPGMMSLRPLIDAAAQRRMRSIEADPMRAAEAVYPTAVAPDLGTVFRDKNTQKTATFVTANAQISQLRGA